MIKELLNETANLIKNCSKIPQEETEPDKQQQVATFEPQENRKKISINDFQNSFEKIQKKIKEMIKDIKNTTVEDEKNQKMKDLLSYLNEYIDWLEGCQKVYEQIERTKCSKMKECFQLVQFLTIFNERKKNIHYTTSNIEGQIATLKRILEEMNKFYQALFVTSEDLISKEILPRGKNEMETLEEYDKEVEQFLEETNKKRIENLIRKMTSPEQVQTNTMENNQENSNVTMQEINEKNWEEIPTVEPISLINEQININPEEQIFSDLNRNSEENLEKFKEIKTEVQEASNMVPEFLKPYVEEAKKEKNRQNNEFVKKRAQAIKAYKEKLYKQMEIYNNQKAIESISPGILEDYQKTLPYQEVCTREINRLQNLTSKEINDPNADLNIPDENQPMEEILEYLLQNQKFSNSSPNYPKTYPTLHVEKPLEYLPTTSKKKYTPRGTASPKITHLIQKNLKKIAFAAIFFLGFGKSEFLSEAHFLETPTIKEKEVDFEHLLNIGDLVELKSFDVPAFETPKINESSKKIPLYAPDFPRTVESIFMKSKNDEIIEIHEDRERNFYLEQGYELLSVGLIDGYFKVEDVVALEKELGIK